MVGGCRLMGETGYGGFSISINPTFSPAILTFLKLYGAVFALPNIRGGGEFGEEWHDAGIWERKVGQCFSTSKSAVNDLCRSTSLMISLRLRKIYNFLRQ
jgi:prolyl oligopeptidase PreP (S9A serine peptidase family)